MEQLQCALLGFFGDVITENGVNLKAPDAPFSHPSEVALIHSAMPLAKDYEALNDFRERSAGGGVQGFCANALAVAADDVLRLYEADVLAVHDASDILRLKSRYGLFLRKIVAVTQTPDTEHRLRLIEALTAEPRLPLDLRAAAGERVHGALLRNVAHWVAHGEVMDHSDFFVVASDEQAEDGSVRQWSADRSRVPPGWSDALLAHVVIAGKERRLLLREGSTDLLDRRSMSEAERMRERNDAAAVFGRLCDPTLIDSGAVVLDELERRVRKAREHWSSIIWRSVKDRFRMLDQLDAVRDMYLCRRGDVWASFVASAGPNVLFAKPIREPSAAVSARLAQDQRVIAAAFRDAMQMSRLQDNSLYKPFAMHLRDMPPSSSSSNDAGELAPGQPLTLDAIGALTLGNVRRLALQFRLPPGMALIVSPNSQRRYVRVFALHIALKLSLFGLNEIRRFAGQVSRSYNTSPLLRKLMHLTGTLHFILTNVAFCLQGDVQETHFKALMTSLKDVSAVDAARRAHELFMEELYGGAFLLPDGVDVARSLDASMMLALGLHVILKTDRAQAIIRASAGTSARQGGIGAHSFNEVQRMIDYASAQLHRRVVSTIAPTIALDTRPAHRALWTRLDLNRWMSEQAAVAAQQQQRHDVEREERQRQHDLEQQQQQQQQRQHEAHRQQQAHQQRQDSRADRHGHGSSRPSSGRAIDPADRGDASRPDGARPTSYRGSAAASEGHPSASSSRASYSAPESSRPSRVTAAHIEPMADGMVRVVNRTSGDGSSPAAAAAGSVSGRSSAASSSFIRPSTTLSASAAAALQSRRDARARQEEVQAGRTSLAAPHASNANRSDSGQPADEDDSIVEV